MAEVAQLRSVITTLLKANSSPQEAQPLYGISLKRTDSPQALIVIGDSKQIFVGKSASTPAPAQSWGNKSYGGNNNNNRDRDIKRGMCFNNATHLVANNPAYHAMDDAEIVESIMDLTDSLFTEYMKRYGN